MNGAEIHVERGALRQANYLYLLAMCREWLNSFKTLSGAAEETISFIRSYLTMRCASHAGVSGAVVQPWNRLMLKLRLG